MARFRASEGPALSTTFVLVVLTVSLVTILGVPGRIRAASVVELSPSDGSTVCSTSLSGPGVASASWNASSSTCTVLALPDVGPTVCIASSPGGCSGSAIDQMLIDKGVTVLMRAQGPGSFAVLCVYSTLVNYGTITGGSICDYGTIINYGKIYVPVENYFETLPYNGFGILDNGKGGEIFNDYNFVIAGEVLNEGKIFNRGVFGNDNQYKGNFTNNGTFVGSAPCFSYHGCRTSIGTYDVSSTGTTIDMTVATGVSVTIRGASGTKVAVISQNQTKASPMGLGSLNVSSPIFYDVLIYGISTGTARICITNSFITEPMDGEMQYWNKTTWTLATNQTVAKWVPPPDSINKTSASSNLLNLCGNVPVQALSGTPIGAGSPLGISQQTTTSEVSTPQPSLTDQNKLSTGPPMFDWRLYVGVGILLLAAAIAVAVVLDRRPRRGVAKDIPLHDQVPENGTEAP